MKSFKKNIILLIDYQFFLKFKYIFNNIYINFNHILFIDIQFKILKKKFKGEDGIVKIYYNNDYIGRNKFLDGAFYVA